MMRPLIVPCFLPFVNAPAAPFHNVERSECRKGHVATAEVGMGYKLYCIDATGHVVSSQDLRVRDDLSALREAEKASDHHAIEIW